jgi:anti-sigma regulatory factor (Ser/Thr protein kinase)
MDQSAFQHQALIYVGADEYLAGTMPFVREALAAGEPILIAVGEAQRELIAGELGPDASRALVVDLQRLGSNPALAIPLWRDFVADHDGRPVRGIGEPACAGHRGAALEECHRHECLLNHAFHGSALSLLCSYDAELLSDEALERVARSHELISRQGRTQQSARRFEAASDCLAGELSPPHTRPEALAFGLTDLGEVRQRVAAAAERAGLDPRGSADLVTAASELAANSVAHGGGRGTLRLWRDGGDLLAEVEDDGLIEEPLVGRLRPEISQEGGRGLWLANQLCELVQIRSSAAGTKVRLHVPARGAALA